MLAWAGSQDLCLSEHKYKIRSARQPLIPWFGGAFLSSRGGAAALWLFCAGEVSARRPGVFRSEQNPSGTTRSSSEDGMPQKLGLWGFPLLPDWLVLGI